MVTTSRQLPLDFDKYLIDVVFNVLVLNCCGVSTISPHCIHCIEVVTTLWSYKREIESKRERREREREFD